MFEKKEIGIKDDNGKELCCGDVVAVTYEHLFGEMNAEGLIVYDKIYGMFMVEFNSGSTAVFEFKETGIEFVAKG